MRTTEQQIDEFVMAAGLIGLPKIREAARNLLAGKFAEEPLPEIFQPPWTINTPSVTGYREHIDEPMMYYVGVGSTYPISGTVSGPKWKSQREAILAWNAGMRGEPPPRCEREAG
jgi:hypothetical protein